MVRATFAALESMESPRNVASRRGLKVSEIVSGRDNRSETKNKEKASEEK